MTGFTLKFQVNKDVLSEAVSFAVRLLPQRTTLPILGGILIEADANALRLSVFDYEVSAQAEIVAKVEGEKMTGYWKKMRSDFSFLQGDFTAEYGKTYRFTEKTAQPKTLLAPKYKVLFRSEDKKDSLAAKRGKAAIIFISNLTQRKKTV